MQRKAFNVKISDKLLLKLKNESKLNGIKIWKMVTIALENYLNKSNKQEIK